MEYKNIAVIGGAGFVGTSLSNRLRQSNYDHTIFDIDQTNESTCFLDVEDPNALKKLKDYDLIINLAAVHRDDVKPISRYDDVNVMGAKNICHAARQNNISTIIFTSSVAVYGFAPDNTDEEGSINYFNHYGRTKYLAEQYFKSWHAEDPNNRTLVIIRPTVIFGEGNRGNVFNLLKQIATKKFFMIGPGKNKKSMAYIENVTAFIEHSMVFDRGTHIYNYVDKLDFSMNELVLLVNKFLHKRNTVGLRIPIPFGLLIGYVADLISLIFRRPLPVSSIRVKKFVSSTLFDSSMDKYGFVPPVSLEEGLKRTLRYEFVENDNYNKGFTKE